ncbi:MAG TPA: SsrA-binding protein SmpB [bacterium]|nr:SsrA-binding protein SmpB [bacterium]
MIMGNEEKYRIVARNKRAYFDYEIYDKFEAGIVLTGSEIKSLRNGSVNISEGYVRIIDGEALLMQAKIEKYKQGGKAFNHEPFRKRKLLLHRREIDSIAGRVQRRGLTILPLKVYLKGNLAKVEIGLAKNKKKYDKRQDIIKKEHEKEAGRILKIRSR